MYHDPWRWIPYILTMGAMAFTVGLAPFLAVCGCVWLTRRRRTTSSAGRSPMLRTFQVTAAAACAGSIAVLLHAGTSIWENEDVIRDWAATLAASSLFLGFHLLLGERLLPVPSRNVLWRLLSGVVVGTIGVCTFYALVGFMRSALERKCPVWPWPGWPDTMSPQELGAEYYFARLRYFGQWLLLASSSYVVSAIGAGVGGRRV